MRSERVLMEQMRYNLLFRWFVGLAIEGARINSQDHTEVPPRCSTSLVTYYAYMT